MADRHQVGRRLLDAGARALRQRRPVRAGEAFQAALTVFGGPDMGMARGHALRGMAEAAAAANEPERALYLLELARSEYRWLRKLLDELAVDEDLKALSVAQSTEAEAVTLVIEANIALVRGDVRTAHDRVNLAYPMFKEVGEPRSSSSLWDTTARIAAWEGRHVAAIRAWTKSLKLLGDGDLRARCLTGLRLAEACLEASQLDKARERLEEAELLAREFEEPALTGRVYLAWGTWHARHDAFEAALDAYEDALGAFREASDDEQVLATQIRAARVASRSGRMEVVGRLRDALERLASGAEGKASHEVHPTALGVLLALIGEHALSLGRPEVALVAVASARRFWGEREPVDGRGPLLRMAVRALAELGDLRSATTVAHQLAASAGEGSPGAIALRDAWRRRAPADWLTQIDDLAPETLAAQTDTVIDKVFVSWGGRLGLDDRALGTVTGALALCTQLSERAATVAIDDDKPATDPMLVWESGGSERQQTALPQGIVTLGRALDNDIAMPWDRAVAEVHCVLQRDDAEVLLVLPEGRNPGGGAGGGVLVDGQPVRGEHVLRSGQRISIGDNVLRYQLGAQSTAAAGVAGVPRVAVTLPAS